MSVPDVVIRGGLAVLPDGPVEADIGVIGESIGSIGKAGSVDAKSIVDATGLVVLPGGIDPHVHVATQFGEWRTNDDFRAATIAAAHGGTTAIIEFAIPRTGETAWSALERCREEAKDSVVDYAFHACVVKDNFRRSVAELQRIRESGVGSVKVFSAYLDTIGLTEDQIQEVLAAAAASDLQVLVHAESPALIDAGIAKQVRRGNLGPSGHLESRSAESEAEAINSIAVLAKEAGARVFFVHVSSGEGVAALRKAKQSTNKVHGETCVQYLILDASVYQRPHGERWICSPPIRALRHQDALWAALLDGTLDLVSTDHNCFDSGQKARFKDDFRRVPNGLPGVELRLPALLSARSERALDWATIARLTAEAPARDFGLWPRKGAIRVGADADLVLLDPSGSMDLSASHMATDYSPFEGMVSRGAIVATWAQGRRLVHNGTLAADARAAKELLI
jgi:dihydropyrimidinase